MDVFDYGRVGWSNKDISCKNNPTKYPVAPDDLEGNNETQHDHDVSVSSRQLDTDTTLLDFVVDETTSIWECMVNFFYGGYGGRSGSLFFDFVSPRATIEGRHSISLGY